MTVIYDPFFRVWSVWTIATPGRHVADYATEAAARAAIRS
jgi:hypothetical protein